MEVRVRAALVRPPVTPDAGCLRLTARRNKVEAAIGRMRDDRIAASIRIHGRFDAATFAERNSCSPDGAFKLVVADRAHECFGVTTVISNRPRHPDLSGQ